MSDKINKRRSVNYKKALTQSIHSGDFEGIIRNIMLLAVKHNDEQTWKMGPRTFMELCQVLLKFRSEFGNNEDMDQILKVLEGGQNQD